MEVIVKMSNIDISNKESLLKCYRNELVPENPKVDEYGVKGLLLYRKNNNKRHPDSALSYSETKWIAQKLYGEIPDSQDTIFNCWNLIKIYDAIHSGLNITRDSDTILLRIESGEEIIKPEHLAEINLLADRQHCIANFMPAPKGFNGWKNSYSYHPGKGEYYKDNDFPDIYYKRAKKEFPQMYTWINANMKKYSLQLFDSQITPWENRKANFKSMGDKPSEELLFTIAQEMNRLLCERAENLINNRIKS